MELATPKQESKTRCAQIWADDYAALNARRSRTGLSIVRQIHEAVVLLCSKEVSKNQEVQP